MWRASNGKLQELELGSGPARLGTGGGRRRELRRSWSGTPGGPQGPRTGSAGGPEGVRRRSGRRSSSNGPESALQRAASIGRRVSREAGRRRSATGAALFGV
eukprot:7936761-Pyramimonas_sp.AAC.1